MNRQFDMIQILKRMKGNRLPRVCVETENREPSLAYTDLTVSSIKAFERDAIDDSWSWSLVGVEEDCMRGFQACGDGRTLGHVRTIYTAYKVH